MDNYYNDITSSKNYPNTYFHPMWFIMRSTTNIQSQFPISWSKCSPNRNNESTNRFSR